MASIEKRKRSTRVITYVDGEKVAFPLGPVPGKTAERFANNVDALLYEIRCNVLPHSREVANWLADLDDKLYGLLVERGLAKPRVQAVTLNPFIESYIERRTDVTERRVEKLRQAKARLIEYFGDVALDTITPGDAEEYARWLLTETKLAPTTAHKECQIARQFFRHAVRKRLIASNPLEDVSIGTATNEDRRVFVPADVVETVIEACPDWQWRTVVALARYGGLRYSSEVALLKLTDIHWDSDRMTVTSLKTARYGKTSRIVPIFPELRTYLQEAWDAADEGEQWVVPMLEGKPDKNLGTTFKKIIAKAGVEGWVKPFQNLRASRQTELEQNYPTYVVCKWLGNTPNVARKHYLTVTEDHFRTAATGGQTGDKRGTRTLAETRSDAHEKTRTPVEVRENASFSEVIDLLRETLVAGTGFEAPPFSSGNTPLSETCGTESGTVGAQNAPVTTDLAVVIDAWPKLSEEVRRQVVELVREAGWLGQ